MYHLKNQFKTLLLKALECGWKADRFVRNSCLDRSPQLTAVLLFSHQLISPHNTATLSSLLSDFPPRVCALLSIHSLLSFALPLTWLMSTGLKEHSKTNAKSFIFFWSVGTKSPTFCPITLECLSISSLHTRGLSCISMARTATSGRQHWYKTPFKLVNSIQISPVAPVFMYMCVYIYLYISMNSSISLYSKRFQLRIMHHI